MKKNKNYLVLLILIMLSTIFYTSSSYGQTIENEISDGPKNNHKPVRVSCINSYGEIDGYGSDCAIGIGICYDVSCH